jgi:hypothetical protein
MRSRRCSPPSRLLRQPWPRRRGPPLSLLPSQPTWSIMSDATVRETVSEIVTQVAERLVRDEIERIKQHLS